MQNGDSIAYYHQQVLPKIIARTATTINKYIILFSHFIPKSLSNDSHATDRNKKQQISLLYEKAQKPPVIY